MNSTSMVHRAQQARATSEKLLTIFSLPKPFTNRRTRIHQTNAILSWRQLQPAVEIILFGDDEGIEEFAQEHGLIHGGALRRNEFSTPLLSDAFHRAHDISAADTLMYSNADVIYTPELLSAVMRIRDENELARSVTFGRRVDVTVDDYLDWSRNDCQAIIDTKIKRNGRRSPIVCKEYFLFSRGLYEQIPDFAVGRGNWDNWMIHHARTLGVPVVNASAAIQAIHQRHDYHHLRTSRLGCYVTCPEARANLRLAGGWNGISGSSGTWHMNQERISKNSRARWNADFWLDLPEFARMVLQLPFQR